MGNTVGTEEAAYFKDHQMSEEEAERLFREKIGYISIIKNRQIRRSNSNPAQMPKNSPSWTSSITSPSEITPNTVPAYPKIHASQLRVSGPLITRPLPTATLDSPRFPPADCQQSSDPPPINATQSTPRRPQRQLPLYPPPDTPTTRTPTMTSSNSMSNNSVHVVHYGEPALSDGPVLSGYAASEGSQDPMTNLAPNKSSSSCGRVATATAMASPRLKSCLSSKSSKSRSSSSRSNNNNNAAACQPSPSEVSSVDATTGAQQVTPQPSSSGISAMPSTPSILRSPKSPKLQRPRPAPTTKINSPKKTTQPRKATASPGIFQMISNGLASNPEPMTESLLKEMQAKMARVNLERESCLSEIQNMNLEAEHYRTETTQKLAEKDQALQRAENEIAALRQQMVRASTEHQDDKQAAHTETRNLLRKVSKLQNHLRVVEQQRDASLAALDAANEGINSTATPKEEELKETIQDLLRQLEDSEEEHQREQSLLNNEIVMLRKKLERLESEYINVERERDESYHKVESIEQQLELEKAMTQADLRKYQEELAKWKERYEQDLQFATNTQEHKIQRNAVVMGNRLSAGILEGIQEDEELVMKTDANGVTTARFNDDDSSTYSRILGRMRSLASPIPMMEITNISAGMVNTPPSPIESCSPRMAPSPRHSQGFGWVSPSKNNNNHGYQPSAPTPRSAKGGFEESISIQSFLSQVW